METFGLPKTAECEYEFVFLGELTMNIKKIIKELGFLTIATIFVLATVASVWGQVNIATLGTPYTQNFDTLAVTGNTNPFTDNTTIPGWYSNRTVYIADDGTNTTGGLHSYGANASTERALGAVTSGGTPTVQFGVRLANTTGANISSLDISFIGEQWRRNTATQTLVFEYQVGATSLTTGVWTPVTDLNFTAPQTGAAAALDGNDAANQSAKSNNLSVNVSAGQEIWFRWTKTGSNSPGLAIDTFSVTANGGGASNSNASDIVSAGNETSDDINYLAFQSPTITTTSEGVRVFSVTVRDGGAAANDADTVGTILTSLTFGKGVNNTVSNFDTTIRQAALFDGTNFINATSITADSISFSGLNIVTPDNQSRTLDLYLTFETTVTDNQQFQFAVAGATANGVSGSTFAAPNAGGATSSTTGDSNRIEVTADRLQFLQQPPATVFVDIAITPAVLVQVVDVNGRRDLDYTADVTISATGATLSNSSTTAATPTNGIATFSNIIFSTTGMGVTLNAASGALTGAVSDAFTVAPAPILPAAGEIVINQFSSDYAGASDEYVEIINLTDKTFDLSLLRIEYQSAGGTGGGAGGTLSGTLQPYSFFLLSPNATVTINGNAVNRDAAITAGFAVTAGQFALRRTTDNLIIDGLAYGTVTVNNLGEGAAAPAPPTDGGLRRDPDGDDTNVNADDFVTVANAAIRVRNSSSRFLPGGVPLAAGTYTDISIAGNTTLAGQVTITGVLTLNGLLNAGTNRLTINCGASVAGAGETAYIVGDVRKNFCDNTPFSFPVGQNGYSPVTVTPTNSPVAGTALTVDVEDAILPGLSAANSVSRFWSLTETGDLTATLLFDYRPEDVNGAMESMFNIYKREAASPIQVAGTIDVTGHNALVTPAISEFSDWGVGLLAPLAASSTVSGRVRNQDGRGLAYVDVMLTSSEGEVYTTTTGENGRYSFADVPSGITYVISVQSKRYRFAESSQVINLTENITEVNFIGSGR